MILRWVKIFSFDAESLSCFGGQSFDFYNKLMVQTLVPIIICAPMLILWLVKSDWNQKSDDDSQAPDAISAPTYFSLPFKIRPAQETSKIELPIVPARQEMVSDEFARRRNLYHSVNVSGSSTSGTDNEQVRGMNEAFTTLLFPIFALSATADEVQSRTQDTIINENGTGSAVVVGNANAIQAPYPDPGPGPGPGPGSGPSLAPPVGDDKATAKKSSGDKYLALLVYVSYLVLPSVTTTIFTAFPVMNMNPSNVVGLPFADKFLAADFSIVYDSPRYWQGVYWAIAMIAVYPVGIPLFYYWLLYTNRHDIEEFKNLEAGVFSLTILFTFPPRNNLFKMFASFVQPSGKRQQWKATRNRGRKSTKNRRPRLEVPLKAWRTEQALRLMTSPIFYFHCRIS